MRPEVGTDSSSKSIGCQRLIFFAAHHVTYYGPRGGPAVLTPNGGKRATVDASVVL